MGFRLSAATRNALSDAFDTEVNTGASTANIKVYTGAQPTNPDTSVGGATHLATFNLSNPAFGASASGVITLAGTPISATGLAAGTAGFFRLFDRNGDSIADGTVGASGSGATLELTTTTISVGVQVDITAGTVTTPLGT